MAKLLPVPDPGSLKGADVPRHCSHCWTRYFQLWFPLISNHKWCSQGASVFWRMLGAFPLPWVGAFSQCMERPRLSMPGDVGYFKASKIQLFKEAWPRGGKAVVQVLLKPHPAVGSQVWHSKSLALFKFGLKISMKSYSTCWVTTFHNVITWPFQRVGFRSTYYWLKACQISSFLSKLHVMFHGDPLILFLIRCCSWVHETEGKQSDILKKYVLSRNWGIQRNTRKAFWD